MNKTKRTHGKNICGEKFCHGDLCVGKVKPVPNKQGSPTHGMNANSVDRIKSLLKLELSKPTVDDEGDTEWRLPNGSFHRDYGPAVEHPDGGKEWYKNGKRHREDGPAVEYKNGDKIWFKNGKLHREDGPAHECASGEKEWWVNGKQHREDGPAVEDADGNKEWRINDRRHRKDGPAIERDDGQKEWWVNGRKKSEDEFNYWLKNN